jgi:hypothetical protein
VGGNEGADRRSENQNTNPTDSGPAFDGASPGRGGAKVAGFLGQQRDNVKGSAMTRERVETLAKLAREYGFQTLYAVVTLFVVTPWMAAYVILPIAQDHREFLRETTRLHRETVAIQRDQSQAIRSIEWWVEQHARNESARK